MPNNKSDKQIRKYLSFDGREATSNVTNINQGYNNTLYLADGTIVTFGWVYENCANDAIECGDISVTFPGKMHSWALTDFSSICRLKGLYHTVIKIIQQEALKIIAILLIRQENQALNKEEVVQHG